MIVERRLRRTTKITITTRPIVRIKRELDVADRGADGRRAIDDGRDLDTRRNVGGRRGNSALIRSTVSITFASGCLETISAMARRPLIHAASVVSAGPSTAWPMSLDADRCAVPVGDDQVVVGSGLCNWSLS